MKENVISLSQDISNNAVVYFSEPVVVTKKTLISVPGGYKAYGYIDEKLSVRIEPCINMNIYKEYGKSMLGKTIRVAYILNKALPQMLWGVGNINVNNERLKEAYRIGANGRYMVEIIDYVKLIAAFASVKQITDIMIREKTISIVKSVALPVIGEFFAHTNVSVFEISSLLDKVRERMLEALKKEKMFGMLGLSLSELTVEGLHVNENDLQSIRQRLNS
ncbi:MAG: hypothetical protein ACOYEC_01760 [Christensenellales bacterium]|jgi:membrane protease subunit (stomatin/prohibitin family)|nr:hypothetical protein [Clostridiales bacterium]